MRALAAVAFTFSTLAGSPGTVVNSQDGPATSAQFDAPRGVAVDRAGTIYVADTTNNTIRRITASGEWCCWWCRHLVRRRCLQQRNPQGHV
jgi:hypothetical protein